MTTVVFIGLLVAIPVVAWWLVPFVNRRLGRPLDSPPAAGIPFSAKYGWYLRMNAVVGLPFVLSMAWIVCLIGVVGSLI